MDGALPKKFNASNTLFSSLNLTTMRQKRKFFNDRFGYGFFYMRFVGYLGGAVDPEIGCVVNCVVVEATGACWGVRLGIRRD